MTSNTPSTAGTLVSFQDPQPIRSLMGAVVSNAYQLTDHEGQPGIFFVFQDLSVRVEGRFTLKFMFINLSEGDPLTMSTNVLNSVFSIPFTVYSAKNFPGMTGKKNHKLDFIVNNQNIRFHCIITNICTTRY